MNITFSRPRATGVLVAPLIALVALFASTAPAGAFPGQTTDGTQGGRVGHCYASAGPSYLGLRCITANLDPADRKTASDILCYRGTPTDPKPLPPPRKPSYAGDPGTPGSGPVPPKDKACDPVPRCWYLKLNSEEQAILGKVSVEEPGGVVYYWFRCLNGFNDKREQTGPATIDQTPAVLDFEDPPKQLTKVQNDFIGYFFKLDDNNYGTPPVPKGSASPNLVPRVNTDVSFFDAASLAEDSTDGSGSVVSVRAGGARLMAVENYAEVSPTGDDADSFRCKRQGPVDPNAGGFDENATVGLQAGEDATRASAPNACWYTYKQSSADQRDSVYHGQITSHWSVWSKDGGGGWQPFSPNGDQVEFTKKAGIDLGVTEVQAVNVLPDGVTS